jgi:hypothetical protein
VRAETRGVGLADFVVSWPTDRLAGWLRHDLCMWMDACYPVPVPPPFRGFGGSLRFVFGLVFIYRGGRVRTKYIDSARWDGGKMQFNPAFLSFHYRQAGS